MEGKQQPTETTLTLHEEEGRPPDPPRDNPVELTKPVDPLFKYWVALFFLMELFVIIVLLTYYFSPNNISSASARRRRWWLIVLAVLVVSSTLGISAFYLVRRKRLPGHGQSLYKRGIAAIATVTEIHLDKHEDSYFSKYAWVVRWEFEDADNKKIFTGMSALANIPRSKVGDRFWILYDKDNPTFNIRWKVFEDSEKFYEHIALAREIIRYSHDRSIEDPRTTITS